MAAFNRLVSLGSALVDLQMFVPRLPVSGGDVLANDTLLAIGGSFNTESAASRLGLSVIHTGSVGDGPYSEMLRSVLAEEGIEFAGEVIEGADLGICLTMVEPDGERSFVTHNGAESIRTLASLEALRLGPTDAVYLAGYDLVYPQSRDVFKKWLFSKPLNGAALFFDPTPLVADIDTELLTLLRQDSFAITANEIEADFLGLNADDKAWFIRRIGARGCELYEQGQLKGSFAGEVVDVIDTTGAGDVHTGALIASLASGSSMPQALQRANRAAAFSITQRGGAAGPKPANLN